MLNNSNPVIYNQMKRPFLLFLPFLLFIAGAFVACEEVEEAGKYDNWVPRNEAFIDSIKGKTGDNIVASLEDAEKMEIGTLYAISVPTSGTGVVFYRGTFITGEEFDGNFDGFGATDREIPLPLSDPLSENSPESKWPTAFNSPSEFVVSKVIAGWTWALQYMRVGERWMLYIPWQSGYGASGSSSGDIPGYTSLTFDVCLEGIAD